MANLISYGLLFLLSSLEEFGLFFSIKEAILLNKSIQTLPLTLV